MGGVVLRYLLMGGLSSYIASSSFNDILSIFWWYQSFVFFVVATLFLLKKGEFLLGKDHNNGQLPFWSLILWWPFHGINILLVKAVTAIRLRKGILEAHEVIPGLVLGGLMLDKRCAARGSHTNTTPKGVQVAAVIDLTCEFSERLQNVQAYLCLPVWDGNAPSIVQLDSAVAFTRKHRKRGVAIHCAFGVGRSTTAMCAVLLSEGKARSIDEALEIIKRSRRIARLNNAMRGALENWMAARRE